MCRSTSRPSDADDSPDLCARTDPAQLNDDARSPSDGIRDAEVVSTSVTRVNADVEGMLDQVGGFVADRLAPRLVPRTSADRAPPYRSATINQHPALA